MRYFFGYIITIGLLILLIVFLVGSGGGKPKTTGPVKLLNSYASTDTQVRLIIDGPITAAQDHQQLRITVSALGATLEHIVGYDGTVVGDQNFTNTQNAYYAFLTALMQANFTKGITSTTFPTDTGLCPLGDRYNFELIQNGQTLQNYWSTSCGGFSTFKGSVPLTLTLFRNQIPGYDGLTASVNL